MNVLVTGGRGFIGSHLVRALSLRGDDVKIFDLENNFDIRDKKALEKVCNGVEIVFHLAALPSVQYSIEHPKESYETNLTGTLNVLEVARTSGVRRVIYSSSSAVYGDAETLPLHEDSEVRPKSPYALQKYSGELLCKLWSSQYGVETVSLRYFNVYGEDMNPDGPYASVIGVFLRQKNAGSPLTITGDGTQTRDFVHVSDVVRANIMASESKNVGNGEGINIGTGKMVSVNELANMIGGPTKRIESRVEPHDSLANIEKAKDLLGWEPSTTVEEGIQNLLVCGV